MLTIFHHTDHEGWTDFLPEFQFAINSSIHDTTLMTPAAMFFRREFLKPGDNAVLSFPHHTLNDDEKPEKDNVEKVQKQNKNLYDKKREQEVNYPEGTLVLLKNFPRSSKSKKRSAKLEPRYKGPYRVKRKLSPLNYELTDIDNENEKRIAHVEQLEKFVE